MAYLCDVNIYVNAHQEDDEGHDFYRRWLIEQLEESEAFLYCDWILSAFIRIVTNPKIYKTPMPVEQAIAFAESIRGWPSVVGIMLSGRKASSSCVWRVRP